MIAESTSNAAYDRPLPRGWLIVFCLWFVAGLNYLDRNLITTMHDSLVGAIPMSEAQYGSLTTIFLFVYGGFSPFAGFLADRLNRSFVIISSVFVWSVVTCLTSLATTFDQLFWARAAMGISEAFYIPAALALITDYHRGATRSFATGLHLSGISAGASLGGLGGVLAASHGWAFPFQIFGVIGIVYSFFLVMVVRDPPKEVSNSKTDKPKAVSFVDAFTHLMTNSRFLLMLVCFSLMGLAGWVMTAWMATYLKERFDMGQGASGMTSTGYLHVAGFSGHLLGGYWADFWTRTNPRARMLVPAVALAIAAPAFMLSATSTLLLFAIVGLIGYGVSRSCADSNMMPILCMVADSRYRATGYGIMNFCACMVGGIGIYAAGVLRDYQVNVSIMFLIAAGGLLLGAALFWLISVMQPKQPAMPKVEA